MNDQINNVTSDIPGASWTIIKDHQSNTHHKMYITMSTIQNKKLLPCLGTNFKK